MLATIVTAKIISKMIPDFFITFSIKMEVKEFVKIHPPINLEENETVIATYEVVIKKGIIRALKNATIIPKIEAVSTLSD